MKRLLPILIFAILLQAYTVYLPIVTAPEVYPLKGLAQAYPGDRFGARWWYVWSVDQSQIGQPGYVPMTRDGLVPDLPQGYDGYLLVFNEPNQPEPYGIGITPQVGADRYAALVAAYPNAKMIVGNVSAWDSAGYSDYVWLQTFKSLISTMPYAWGTHGYVEMWIGPPNLKAFWTAQHNNLGGKFWITEFAETHGYVPYADDLVKWMTEQTWIERWAWFTNRAEGTEEWFPLGWNVQLEDWSTHDLTHLGIWYRDINSSQN